MGVSLLAIGDAVVVNPGHAVCLMYCIQDKALLRKKVRPETKSPALEPGFFMQLLLRQITRRKPAVWRRWL